MSRLRGVQPALLSRRRARRRAGLGADEEWTHTCATFCTWEYSKEEQECYGAMDDECGVPEGCDDVVHGG